MSRIEQQSYIKRALTEMSKRSYVAAQTLARYGDLPSGGGSADYELSASLVTLRNKSRYHARNSGTMRRYLQLIRDNVFGEQGFVFQSRVKKLDGDMDATLNERVEREWANFWENPTVDRKTHGIDLLYMLGRSWARDGEAIVELVRNNRYPAGLALNPIESDLLDETLNKVNQSTGNEIRMGVEINSFGEHVAYWFLTQHPGDIFLIGESPTRDRHRRVPADRVIHLYDKMRPGQTRGEPSTVAALNPIKMLDGYREAEVMGRRTRSAAMGFFETEMPGGRSIDELSDREDKDDNVLEMDMEPGRLKQLPPGTKFTEFSPGGWQGDFAEADGQFKKDVSMGLGISNFSLGMETAGVSYSTGRSVLIEDRDHYRTLQGFFIRSLMQPIFRFWLSMNSMSPTTEIPPTRLDVIRRSAVFRGRGWDWVDPSKDVSANAQALETGQTSLSRIAASRGIDVTDLMSEIEAEIEMMSKLKTPLQHPILSATKGVAGQQQVDEDDSDANSDD
jgi:lambda family phage portal protein